MYVIYNLDTVYISVKYTFETLKCKDTKTK